MAGLLLGAAGLALTGFQVLPPALWVLELRNAAEDPVALTTLRLRNALTTERVHIEIEEAVRAEDEDLARSFIVLAEAQEIPVDAAWSERVEELERTQTQRAVRDFASGFLSGTSDSMPGISGAFAGDLVGYGDLRDLWQQGTKLAKGEPYDDILLGMSVVGLAVTGATWASAGMSAPARAGVTALKTARKTGRLSGPLAASLAGMTRHVIDGDAARAVVKAARRLDLQNAQKAAGAAVRRSTVGSLKNIADDTAIIYAKTGHRGVLQALSTAESADDLRRAARLTEALGPKARAALKVLGRGALVLGSAFASLLSWIWLALTWTFAILMFSRRLGIALGQLIWRSRAAS